MHDLLLKPVIEILEKEGASEEEIATMIADLTQAATVLLYKQAHEIFSDEDMQKLESAPNDEEANKLILEMYTQHTGSMPQQVLDNFLKKFVEEFVKENSKS